LQTLTTIYINYITTALTSHFSFLCAWPVTILLSSGQHHFCVINFAYCSVFQCIGKMCVVAMFVIIPVYRYLFKTG